MGIVGKRLGDQIQEFRPEKDTLSIWWMHQAGFTLKIGEKTICIDLFLSDADERVVPPIMRPEDLRDVDYFLGTHDHIDHIDRAMWPRLAKSSPDAKFLVPSYSLELLRKELPEIADRLIGVGNHRPFEEDGLRVCAIPSAHELLEQNADGEYAAVGYLVSYQGFSIYHSGDCCMYEGLESRLKKASPIDVMMLPITGRCAYRLRNNIIGNMTYQEAADLAGAVKPGLVIPMHYNAYAGNLENPLLFLDYLQVKYRQQPGAILTPGERFDVRKGQKTEERRDSY